MSWPLWDGGAVSLGEEEVHLWRLWLDAPADGLRHLLSVDERQRADRFAFERDRERWTAARAGLRRILAAYLGVEPRLLQFEAGPFGKPHLVPDCGLRFNLSHSGNVALVAVARGRDLGVDVERIGPEAELEQIAPMVLSAGELAEWTGLPREDRVQGFFNAWSRKEAFIKAVGEGVSFGLQRFDVTLAPGAPARLLRVEGGSAADWTLHAVEAAPGYAASVCVKGRGWALVPFGL